MNYIVLISDRTIRRPSGPTSALLRNPGSSHCQPPYKDTHAYAKAHIQHIVAHIVPLNRAAFLTHNYHVQMDLHSTFLCNTHRRICYFQVEKYQITLILVQGLWLNALEKWPNSFDHHLPVYQQTHKRFKKALTTSNHISKIVSTSKLSNSDFILSSTPVLETNALVCPFTSDISVSYSLSSSFIISYSGHRLLLATVCKQNFSQKSNMLNHNDDTFH